jgi:hypothetical protein
MHAGVHARVGDERRDDAERDPGLRPSGADAAGGIVTWRATGTSYTCLSGRRRLPIGLSTRLTTADVSAMDVNPFSAARRPRLPPHAASTAEQPSHSRE